MSRVSENIWQTPLQPGNRALWKSSRKRSRSGVGAGRSGGAGPAGPWGAPGKGGMEAALVCPWAAAEQHGAPGRCQGPLPPPDPRSTSCDGAGPRRAVPHTAGFRSPSSCSAETRPCQTDLARPKRNDRMCYSCSFWSSSGQKANFPTDLCGKHSNGFQYVWRVKLC